MKITLSPRDEQYIAEKLKSGAYVSPDEVLREGLRLLEKEDERRRKIDWLRTEVEKGFESPSSPWTRLDPEQLRNLVSERAGRVHEG